MSPLTASADSALSLIIREEAHLDANEAYTYYEEKSPGLGERFLQELIQRYNEITEHPEYLVSLMNKKLSGM
jgi:hypothetical protein